METLTIPGGGVTHGDAQFPVGIFTGWTSHVLKLERLLAPYEIDAITILKDDCIRWLSLRRKVVIHLETLDRAAKGQLLDDLIRRATGRG